MNEEEIIEVHEHENFCRVFRLPQEYPKDFCFGGGHEVNFQLVDWFNPVSDVDIPVNIRNLKNRITNFIREKQYYDKNSNHLVVTDFDYSFLIPKVFDESEIKKLRQEIKDSKDKLPDGQKKYIDFWYPNIDEVKPRLLLVLQDLIKRSTNA